MALASLVRSVQAGLAPCYLVVGEARSVRVRACATVRDAVMPSLVVPAFNHSVWRADDGDPTAALAAARTPPMMADWRLVEVRCLEAAPDAFFAALVAYFESPSPTTVLLVEGERFPKVVKGGSNWQARLKRALGDRGVLVDAKADPTAARGLMRDRAAALDCALDADAARLLEELLGADADRLVVEIDKLVAYVGDAKRIRAADVAAATSHLAEAEVWDLTNGIAASDADASLAALERLLNGGEDPRKLLAMLAWKLRDLLNATAALRGGEAEGSVQRRLRLPPAAVRQLVARARRGAPLAPHAVIGAIADANRAMNRHRAGDRRVIEALVLDLLAR